MLSLTITLTGKREFVAKMAKLGNELHNMRRAFKEIVESTTSYFANEAFRSNGGVFRARWSPLSRKYANRKRRIWGNKPILIASGTMQKNFYGEYNSTSAKISNKSKQFKYHQSSADRHVIPRRQMIGVNSKVKTMVREIIRADVSRKMRAV